MNTQGAARMRMAKWDPFRPLDTEPDAADAARQGVWPAAFLFVLAAASAAGQVAFGRGSTGWTLLDGCVAIAVALAGWRIWYRRGRWSSLLVATLVGWRVLEGVAGLAFHSGGTFSPFLYLMLGGATIASVRGSWRLHQIMGRNAVDPAIFD